MMRLPSFQLPLLATLSCAGVLGLVACGGISNPSKTDGTVATVTGALTGADVPANAHVALVWRVGDTGTYEVGSDVAVVNGSFTMNLGTPSNSYFFAGDFGDTVSTDFADAPPISAGETPTPDGTVDPHKTETQDAGVAPSPPTDTGNLGGAQFSFASRLSPRDTAGGQISKPLSTAVAGFVVYVDKNGNGKLDISGEYVTTDEVIGGSPVLALTYFRDGGTLDYEKMRDKAATPTSLPKAGYNLLWTDEGRWLSLNAIDLQLRTLNSLPSVVCTSKPSSSSGWGEAQTTDLPPVARNEGTLNCSDDGRSYSIDYSSNCEPTTPTPVPPSNGLCSFPYGTYPTDPLGCTGANGGLNKIGPNDPVPSDWPCKVLTPDYAADAGDVVLDGGSGN